MSALPYVAAGNAAYKSSEQDSVLGDVLVIMGTVYGGRWETRGTLGKGGQSDIFEAIDMLAPTSEPVALKRIKNPQRLNWFFDEAEAIARIDHPNIIKLIEFSASENASERLRQAYLVMPRARGGDLSTRVTQYKGDVGGTLIVAKQIAKALSAAHKVGVIHRDVKPSNILFTGNGEDVWLTDFGVCLLKDPKAAAPEQEIIDAATFTPAERKILEEMRASEAEDIHALGMVIYYMITGGKRVLPHEAGAQSADADELLHQKCPQMMQFLLEKMVCKLETRLRTMAEVIKGLEQITH